MSFAKIMKKQILVMPLNSTNCILSNTNLRAAWLMLVPVRR